VLEPTQIRVELVTRNEPGSDPAGDRLQFVVTDQRANVVLGAAELGGDLADRQRCGPVHARSMTEALYLFTASQTISQSAATAKNHDDANTERPLPQRVVIT
jgi:hypothetical protein